jgi:hypothetical protein
MGGFHGNIPEPLRADLSASPVLIQLIHSSYNNRFYLLGLFLSMEASREQTFVQSVW